MKITEVAARYVGCREGSETHKELIDEYNSIRPSGSYKMTYSDPWCASFVSLCAYKADIKDFPIAVNTETIRHGLETTNIPEAGYLVFFDWDLDGISDHIGIVDYVDEAIISCVEGNSSDKVKRNKYARNYKNILCYGKLPETGNLKEANPDYSKPKGDGIISSLRYPELKLGDKNDYVALLQSLLKLHGLNIGVYGIDGSFGADTDKALKLYQEHYGEDKTGKTTPWIWKHLMIGGYDG